MGICWKCQKEMSDASVTTCTGDTFIKYPDGKILQRIPYNPRDAHFPHWFRCPDCNVVPGGYHHANCEQEHCPKCGGQLIGCSCFDNQGEDDEDKN
jgi:hypothetical protein